MTAGPLTWSKLEEVWEQKFLLETRLGLQLYKIEDEGFWVKLNCGEIIGEFE